MAHNGNGTWRNRIVGYGTKPADQFEAHPRNWRTHPQPQREALAASLNGVGWVGAVIENVRTGHVLDGHERIWQALEHNAEVPYLQVDVSEDEELLVLATFDPITQMALTDADMLAGILADLGTSELVQDDEGLEDLLRSIAAETGAVFGAAEAGNDPGPQIDRAAELQAQWGTERGQVWEIPSATVPGRCHRLMCGDSTSAEDVGRLMQGEKAALLLTDPPYNVAYEYDSIDDNQSREDYRRFCDAFMGIGVAVSDMQVVTPGKANERLYEPAEWMTWYKGFGTSRGHYFKAMVTEPILLFGDKPKNKFYPTDHFDYPTDRIEGLRDMHTCPKPLGLFRALMEPMTEAGDRVYEPFAGSGTTFVVGEQLGRLVYGCEISPAYVAVTLERLAGMGLEPRQVES